MRVGTFLLSHIGQFWEWLIQRWVDFTGREVRAGTALWLEGPAGSTRIGPDFYRRYAQQTGLTVEDRPHGGLLLSFNSLAGPGFVPGKVKPEIARFYENTSDYGLEAWVKWAGLFGLFARFMISAISRNIEQLVLPLDPLTTSRGMSSEVLSLVDTSTGELTYAGWLRKTVATGDIVYAGFYTVCRPPAYPGPCVKVVFPLPNGSATVILKPVNAPGESFKLISHGHRFGGPGYYRVHMTRQGNLRTKQVPIRETIHVYVDGENVLRTDHHFNFWSLRFLTLHYKITPKESQS